MHALSVELPSAIKAFRQHSPRSLHAFNSMIACAPRWVSLASSASAARSAKDFVDLGLQRREVVVRQQRREKLSLGDILPQLGSRLLTGAARWVRLVRRLVDGSGVAFLAIARLGIDV